MNMRLWIYYVREAWHYSIDVLIPPSDEELQVRMITFADVPITPRTTTHRAYTITTLWSYTHTTVRSLIWAIKYRKNRHAAHICAQALAEYIETLRFEALMWHEQRDIILIPIPLARQRERDRGYNQIMLILSQITMLVPNVHIETRALTRTRDTQPQTRLPRGKRLSNIKGAFHASHTICENIIGKHILLIDDVTTTGATLCEAAKTLKKEGVEVECLALAHAGD